MNLSYRSPGSFQRSKSSGAMFVYSAAPFQPSRMFQMAFHFPWRTAPGISSNSVM